jgi:hypothetical protein
MEDKEESRQTFVAMVLAILEDRFPWLGSRQDEPVSGADTVDELNDLYQSLVHECDQQESKDGDSKS